MAIVLELDVKICQRENFIKSGNHLQLQPLCFGVYFSPIFLESGII